MPVFENYSYSASTIGTFINILVNSLTGATDITTPVPKNLNVSVKKGIDTILQSAIDGTPSSDEMPCIRIFYDPYDMIYNNTQNIPLWASIPVKLYFLYAIDHPSPNFTELRDAYIMANLNYLKFNVFPDKIGMQQYTWWRWDNGEGGSALGPKAKVEHNVDIEYLGQSMKITPVSDFGCSKVTMSVIIKNYLGPTDGLSK